MELLKYINTSRMVLVYMGRYTSAGLLLLN